MDRPSLREQLGSRIFVQGFKLLHSAEGKMGKTAGFCMIRLAAHLGIENALIQTGLCFERGFGAKRDPLRAYRYFSRAAQTGNQGARFLQAGCLIHGLGTRQDMAKAAEILEKLAQEGYRDAWINLGICYMEGPDAIRDPEKGRACFEKGAVFGDADALVNLGLWEMDRNQDQEAAYRYFTRAAEKGDARGRYFQGKLLLAGEGAEKDEAAAMGLLKDAADQGFPPAQELLGIQLLQQAKDQQAMEQAASYLEKAAAHQPLALYHFGEYLFKNGKTEGEKVKGIVLIVKAAFQEEANALRAMSRLTMEGIAIPPIRDTRPENPLQWLARNWDRKERIRQVKNLENGQKQHVDFQGFYADAIRGDGQAQFILGWAFHEGKPGKKNDLAAAYWYTLAALQGRPSAQLNLGFLYLGGPEALRDDDAAAFWFEKAAAQGHPKAMYRLGRCYLLGRGREKDAGAAASWIRKAAEAGYARAQHELGLMYYHGEGLEKDEGLAREWMSRAANQGLIKAADFINQHLLDPKAAEDGAKEE